VHTTTFNEYEHVFNYNGDYSGDVIIHDQNNDHSVRIPFDQLQQFVAQKFADDIISKLEDDPMNVFRLVDTAS
jgi:hypothetical protein